MAKGKEVLKFERVELLNKLKKKLSRSAPLKDSNDSKDDYRRMRRHVVRDRIIRTIDVRTCAGLKVCRCCFAYGHHELKLYVGRKEKIYFCSESCFKYYTSEVS